jgi:hypothetical protein
MVLKVLPLWGSSPFISYIYDATPDPEEDLPAAALAFFSHQGNQVFHDPCPDLAEYPQAMGVSSTSAVLSVDRLPNHLLLLGLELMVSLCALSPTDAEFTGTMFMAAYLLPSPQVSSSGGGPPASSWVASRGNCCTACLFGGGTSRWFVCGGSSISFVSSDSGKPCSACLLFGRCWRLGGSQLRGSR